MDLLRMVVKKRTEDKTGGKDNDALKGFASRIAKLKGEGPMATSDEPEVALEVVSINISDIEIPPNYLRKSIGDVSQLVASIKVYGIQQPVKVVKVRGTKKFRLVFGRRRLKAAQQVGLDAVPCIVELVTREDRLMMLSLAENLHRVGITPIEEGDCYKYLTNQAKTPMDELEKNLGLKVEHIKESMDFLTLPENVRKEVMNAPDRFSSGILKCLLTAFRNSKVHGRKLFQSVTSGQVNTVAEAENFLKSL